MKLSKNLTIMLTIFGILLGFNTSANANAVSCNKVFFESQKTTQKQTRAPFIDPNFKVSEKGKIQIKLSSQESLKAKIINIIPLLLRPLLKISDLEKMAERLIEGLKNREQNPDLNSNYFRILLDAFKITTVYSEQLQSNIKKEGPLVVTVNHADGGMGVVAVAEAVRQVRSDVKIVMNTFLKDLPGFSENSILVNPMGTEYARTYNIERRKEIIQWLKEGHAIVIAPAGELSRKEKISDLHAIDTNWKTGTAEFIRSVPDAEVLPVFIEGAPTNIYHKAKKIHPFAGTAMVIRELREQINSTVKFKIGSVVERAQLESFEDRKELMEYLKARTYAMSDIVKEKTKLVRTRKEDFATPSTQELIISELADKEVIYDRDSTQPTKGMKAIVAFGRDIPYTLREIARLREITFWNAGEGTGKALDTDHFDSHYLHIIAWDKRKNQIAGSYRIGLVDKSLEINGIDGLYTSQQFDYKNILNSNLSNGIELGRSFVAPEYQRSLALLTLFNGIGHFVGKNPKYKKLFGAVSISNEYKENSKLLITEWLKKYYKSDLFGTIGTKNEPKFETLLTQDQIEIIIKHTDSIEKLNELIASIEGDPKIKSPQLLSIYAELGARFLAFDKDIEFNTIDGFIITDIAKLTHNQRLKYLGEEGTRNFETYWDIKNNSNETGE